MKNVRYMWVSAAMTLAATLSGCAAESDDVEVSEVNQQVCYTECYYAYYAEPARINLVGECEGLPLVCWGVKTPYRSGGCFQVCNPTD